MKVILPPMLMKTGEPDELSQFLCRIYDRYGYDFREYSVKSISHRTLDFIEQNGFQTLSNFSSQIIGDETLFEKYLNFLLVGVTQLFRSPVIYQTLRDKVFPYLRSHRHNYIWHAGCSSGEEVFSLAILLEEAGLYDRCFLYGTDISPGALDRARHGLVDLESLREGTKNYFASGGAKNLHEYFRVRYGRAVFAKRLRKNIIFADHSLICDAAFCEANLVLCRNVLFYFNQPVRDRALGLMEQSLLPGGFFCLGLRETIYHSSHIPLFERLGGSPFLFRKRSNLLVLSALAE